MAGIPLGPFELLAPIGKGGAGLVYRARHRSQRVPCAIKVITQPNDAVSFQDEVRAIARLTHPSILMVLDHGQVDKAAVDASNGKLPLGAQYLATELASGGSLQRLQDGLSWKDVRAVLLALLDGLAHAHARGVIHRDLKPANVLLCTGDDVRPGLKLSDFGIATALDQRKGQEQSVVGTLHYIAPEQLLGNWLDYGPWTDLYALGCMTYRLVSGRLPFQGRAGQQLMRAHLFEAADPLRPRMLVLTN